MSATKNASELAGDGLHNRTECCQRGSTEYGFWRYGSTRWFRDLRCEEEYVRNPYVVAAQVQLLHDSRQRCDHDRVLQRAKNLHGAKSNYDEPEPTISLEVIVIPRLVGYFVG